MQILFVGQQSLTSPSGLGRHWPLAKEIAALGHRVRMVTLHHDWAQLDHPVFVRENVEVVYAGQMQVLKRDGQKSYFSTQELLTVTFRSALALRTAIIQALAEGFHTVHLMKPQPINGLAWLLTNQQAYRPRLFVDCDDYELGFVAQRGLVIRSLVDWFERQMPRRAQAVTVNTDHARRRLVSQGIAEETILYVPNGVERSRFATRNEILEAEIRQRYRPHATSMIVYIGALNIHSHALDLLVQSFRLAKEQIPNLHLLLIGSGPDRQKLEHLVASMALGDSITFIGQVDPTDVPSYLRIADLSVEATRSTPVAEGRFPLKVVESLAAGVPVVCGAVGERIPTLQPKHQQAAGLLVEPDNPHALADGICTVLRSPGLADRLRGAGLQRAEDFYWDRLAPAIVQLYSAH